MRIVLVPSNPLWPEMFTAERERLRAALGGEAVIEHIGSTAVPGLVAKPVIDILIGLPDFSAADALVPKVVSLGYRYVQEYETVMPCRRFFLRDTDGVRTHHIHMVRIGGEFWARHLLFRDHLRANPDAAREYARLKTELAAREWTDTNEYAGAKTGFIRKMEAKARG